MNTDNIKLEDYIIFIPDRLFNDHRYAIDSSKLEKLGWNITTDFATGLKHVVDYWRNKLCV